MSEVHGIGVDVFGTLEALPSFWTSSSPRCCHPIRTAALAFLASATATVQTIAEENCRRVISSS
jgi:hypothetical protein